LNRESHATTVRPPGYVVLMTACIAPKAGIREHLRRADPEQREQDCATALAFWLQLDEPLIHGVVFADNSGHDLDRLKTQAAALPGRRRPVEFISADYPAPPLTISYGHPEFQLVAEALRRSTLLARERYFIKATGRYRFPGIARLLRRLPEDFKVAVDARGVGLRFGLPDPLVNIALAIFDRDFYRINLAGLPDEMQPAPPWNRRQFVEHLLFDALYPRCHEPGMILRWPCNCEPVGIGANGDNYTSPGRMIRRALRAVARRVAPRIWI
jgi:hypothetical protein